MSDDVKLKPDPGELSAYFRYVLGLVRPGHARPVFHVHKIDPQPIDDWSNEELDLVIHEGRRQIDAQDTMLGNLRTRAQWLVTLGIPILVAIASTQPTVWKQHNGILDALWVFGLVFSAYGILGSAAILTVRLEYGTIDTAKMSAYTDDRRRELAAAYTRIVRTGVNTNATVLTLFWQSVLWLLVGGSLGLVSWLVAR